MNKETVKYVMQQFAERALPTFHQRDVQIPTDVSVLAKTLLTATIGCQFLLDEQAYSEVSLGSGSGVYAGGFSPRGGCADNHIHKGIKSAGSFQTGEQPFFRG